MLVLGVIGIIYGAVLAFGQTDLKRLVAYTSVSHMGFVLIGIFSGNQIALSGAIMQMVAHGISTGALFIIAGMVQERVHTREMGSMGGFWSAAPRLSSVGLVFALASLGLPGFGNFVAEFMVLLGSFRTHPVITVIAAGGLVLAAIYSLWIVQQVFHGGKREGLKLADLSSRETGMMTAMVLAILWLGLYPRPVLDTVAPVLQTIQSFNHREHGETRIFDKSKETKPNLTRENTEKKPITSVNSVMNISTFPASRQGGEK
jgi:NADH-quinone oxidoreductase subunit M